MSTSASVALRIESLASGQTIVVRTRTSTCQNPSERAWPRSPISPERWKREVTLSFLWKTCNQHINENEMHALFSLIRWLSLQNVILVSEFPSWWTVLWCWGLAAKGRSSYRRLNFVLRRYDAYVLACSFFPFYVYVTSVSNPADRSSLAYKPIDSGCGVQFD